MHLYYLRLFKYYIVDKFNNILLFSDYFLKFALKSIQQDDIGEPDIYEPDADEPHDPSRGVLHKWQLDSLQDKQAWRGYQFSVAQWTWNDAASYTEQDEPDDWGDGGTGRIQWQGPIMTLDEVLEKMARLPFKWSTFNEWGLESKAKKLKKTIVQGHARIERLDEKPLSYMELEHISDTFRIKK
jgi:hypothetical protein